MAEVPVITCPECQKKFKPKTDLSGKKIKCPYCTKPFIVTMQKAAGAADAPAQAVSRKIFDDDDDDPNPYGVTALDLTPRCPNCAKEMADEKAFICLYCGYNTMTRQVGRTEKVVGRTSQEHFMHLLPGLVALFAVILLVLAGLFYSLVLPSMVGPTAAGFLGHESLKMWLSMILLAIVWATGRFVYKRLIIEPTPQELKKD